MICLHIYPYLSVEAPRSPSRLHRDFLTHIAAMAAELSACAGLAQSLQVPNLAVLSADDLTSGTILNLTADPSCMRSQQRVDANICRLSMSLTTSPTSNITLEAWLPTNWTGRVMTVGNGGLGGCIQYEDLNYGSKNGFAAIGTNNGHDGNNGKAFLKNPGVVEDYVYRATSSASSMIPAISKQFYSRPHTKAYYLGCSTGGRQGFKMAQDFPEVFDGILAGAPAIDFNALTFWTGHFPNITGPPGSNTFLSPQEWELVYADVLKQCDGNDGATDGILEDPEGCKYCSRSLVCKANQSDSCLTLEKATTAQKVFSPLTGPDGALVFPRLQPGANSTMIHLSGQPSPYAEDWYRFVVYNDSSRDTTHLTLDDLAAAKRLNPFNVETWKGDLSSYQKRGGKLLHWHGLQDEIITSENSARYYDFVAKTMGLPTEELDKFYRYFRISGLGHCFGGDGANYIGHKNEYAVPGFEPDTNILAALVKWVEEGVGPETIRGTRFPNPGFGGPPVSPSGSCPSGSGPPEIEPPAPGTPETNPQGGGSLTSSPLSSGPLRADQPGPGAPKPSSPDAASPRSGPQDAVQQGNGPPGPESLDMSRALGERRHCKYPKKNLFEKGDFEKAESWECK